VGKLGAGLRHFSRENKRLCGFVYLRALRTGYRALSLQKGSLLDTILRLSDENAAEMWAQTLRSLRELEPAIGDIPQLERIRHEIQARTRRFVGISQGDDATAFFASDLTREHLREVVRLFVATDPNDYPLPFQRHRTGTVNVLVFALLTFIADMKRSQSVIFAMEEPEIALPPHTQRRIAGYVLKQMGQAIVTSHSPYVIEQFESPDIVVLTRGSSATLTGKPLDAQQIEPRMFRTQKRQFAEAILARAVIVVEGATELVVLHAVSAALEKYKSPETTLTSTLPGFQYSMPAPTRKSPGTVQCSLELSRFRGQVNGLIQAAASAAFS
jgi:putative ATP-dependent endonuclease of the OLD family